MLTENCAECDIEIENSLEDSRSTCVCGETVCVECQLAGSHLCSMPHDHATFLEALKSGTITDYYEDATSMYFHGNEKT